MLSPAELAELQEITSRAQLHLLYNKIWQNILFLVMMTLSMAVVSFLLYYNFAGKNQLRLANIFLPLTVGLVGVAVLIPLVYYYAMCDKAQKQFFRSELKALFFCGRSAGHSASDSNNARSLSGLSPTEELTHIGFTRAENSRVSV